MTVFSQKFSLKIAILLTVLTFTFGGTALSQTAAPTQDQLEAELRDVENQIADLTKELAKTQTEKKTLTNKIRELQTKQKALALQIKETTIKLNVLSGNIAKVETEIKKNVLKEKELTADTAETLRQMNAVDNNLIVALMTSAGISEFFDQLKQYSQLSRSLDQLISQTLTVRQKMQKQESDLQDKKDETSNLLQIKTIQQQGLSGTLKEQNGLLAETKGVESNYQTILADTKKRAAEIRSRIYELFNTGQTINFGQAVEIAKWASGYTGVRPAFLLAILTQESNLGKNVGTCNRLGDPPSKSWKVIMKPERDQEPFKTITDNLGMNIDTTPVSCPMRDKKGNQIGWGGAMGPAQFIPSTWMGYKDKITGYTGKSYANPWDIRDAFLAASIKLKGDGADGSDDGDWKAAMRYFSGSTNLKYRFYGDNVLATTRQYLSDIAELR